LKNHQEKQGERRAYYHYYLNQGGEGEFNIQRQWRHQVAAAAVAVGWTEASEGMNFEKSNFFSLMY